MLDMRKNKQGNLEFNNIVMTVDNTDAWVDAFNEFFGTECVPVKEVNGGMQYVMRIDDKSFFNTTFYPNTSSCMLQPANNDQDILLQALQILPDVKNIKEVIKTKNKEEEEKTKKSVQRQSSRNKETGKDTGKPQQENGDVPASAPHDDMLKDGLTNSVILNPLLTYIVYGLNSGTTSAVKRAVLGHFTDEKVSQAKDILFDNCDKEIIGDKKKRVTTSARSNTEANLDDVIAAI